MAIDPRISLMTQPVDTGQAIDIYENALMNSQTRDIIQQQEARQAELAPLQLQEQQLATTQARDQARLNSLAEFSTRLKPQLEADIASGNLKPTLERLGKRYVELKARQDAGEDVDTTETEEAIKLVQQGRAPELLRDVNSVLSIGKQQPKTAAEQEFDSFVTRAGGDPESIETQAAKIKLGIAPRQVGSSAQTITQLGTAEDVAETESILSKGKETGKLQAEKSFKPQITKAIKLAEAEAKEKGEVLTDLARMEASLPQVRDVVNELKDLAPLVTSTKLGKLFDSAVKETGFGSTKGANAKAKFIAIIDNQVLPLLKETFGAAFTVQEGENLKSSLADPEASPDQKIEQLNAFMNQKERNIKSKQTQLGSSEQPSSAETLTSPSGIQFTVE